MNLHKPRHVAMIMDGNGRWARQRSLPRSAGHRKGVEVVKKMLSTCHDQGIPYLTLFAFSSENWQRPSAEVELLIELLASTLESEVELLNSSKVRLRTIGDLSRFPKRLRQKISQAEELTRGNTEWHLTIGINYGGRWDITQAVAAIVAQAERGDLTAAHVTPALIESRLCTHELPAPDLFIRTGGEMRISNFLLWQLAYTELVFVDTYWPDFDAACFHRALAQFAGRQRRYGKTGEQLAESGR